MARTSLSTVYWILSGAFLVGSVVAGTVSTWVHDGFQYPHQGLSLALGILSATFAFLADRARRDRGSGDSA